MSSEEFDSLPMALTGQQGYEEQTTEKFNQLVSLNLNDKTESKNGLSYVSWANAWKVFKEVYPTATYRIVKNPQTSLPYFVDPQLGIMVFTEVEANGLHYEMWLPVIDNANRAMKTEAYTYQVWDQVNRKYVDKKVEAASSFDINKALMRCLVKNLAMFGLGLYIYSGDDMPEELTPTDPFEGIRLAINSVSSTSELNALYLQHEAEVKNNPAILALFSARKEQLLNDAA